jgi:predicted nucleotidyltransferase
MHNQSLLNEITNKVVIAAQTSLGSKLDKVILYGSYARGDFNDDSDIDIIVLADIPCKDRGYERNKIRTILGSIDLDYNVILTLKIIDRETFYTFLPVEPFFSNVMKDGVVLSA